MELVTFFFFLTTSLFLGDGKQPFVDAWWALGILTMYGARYYQRGKLDLRAPPHPIGFAWMALVLYHIILIPFSDSAGYSITATIRLVEAHLIYVMFSTISSEQTTTVFSKGLLVVGVVATAASFVFLLSPSLAGFLPPMNLLYTTYGHNHLADLLLFIFPIAITQPWPLLILFAVGMILAFARGAWVLLVVYLLFLARRAGLLAAAATVAAFLLISLGLTPIQKPSLLTDGRWEYWRQSVEAIKERSLFGSGPGTFYLESKRLQSAPSSYSWFAHSFPLQITVESGVVGLVMFLFLLWNVFQKSKRSPLLWGAGLVLVYSLYEFSLDYTVIWLLVWAALGALTTHDAKNLNKPKIVSGALIVLVLFYVSSISSLAASVLGYPKLAFFLAPYDVNAAKDAPSSLTAFFHRKNPEVLFSMAQKQPTGSVRCEQLIPLDKKNKELQQQCIRLLFDEAKDTEAAKALYLLAQDIVPKEALWRLSLEDFTNPHFLENSTYATIDELLFSAQNKRYGFAKLAYVIGLRVVNKDPLLTRRLWVLARETSPGWSYYHIELASLEAWVFMDPASARRLLARCAELKDPRAHCGYILRNTIPPVGSQQANIEAIPNRP